MDSDIGHRDAVAGDRKGRLYVFGRCGFWGFLGKIVLDAGLLGYKHENERFFMYDHE